MVKHRILPIPFVYFTTWEKILGRFPHAKIRKLAEILIREIIITAMK